MTLAFCAHLCPDGDGPGPLHCSGSDLDPGLSADQPGMPEAPHRVQRSDSLTCCCIFLKGLRWQGGSVKRGCLTHREIAG